MTPSDELIFLETEQLITEMEGLSLIANREAAHESADEIMVIALLRAVDNEVTPRQAQELADAYHLLDKRYG